jgi:hypothetical protein
MNALVLLAVLGTSQAAAPAGPGASGWYDDYGAALRASKQAGKPLLIVIDQPGVAAGRLERLNVQPVSTRTESRPDALLKSYVLCRIDAGTKYGEAVAKAFRAPTLPYTAVIDKTGSEVLFSKAGQISSDDWTATLTKFQRGERYVSYQPAVYYQPQPIFCRH